MYCKFCGKQIDDNSTFCNFCGKNLSSSVRGASNVGSVDDIIKNATWEDMRTGQAASSDNVNLAQIKAQKEAEEKKQKEVFENEQRRRETAKEIRRKNFWGDLLASLVEWGFKLCFVGVCIACIIELINVIANWGN